MIYQLFILFLSSAFSAEDGYELVTEVYTSEEEGRPCSICLEQLEEGQRVYSFCGNPLHFLHDHCAEAYIHHNRLRGIDNPCTYCRLFTPLRTRAIPEPPQPDERRYASEDEVDALIADAQEFQNDIQGALTMFLSNATEEVRDEAIKALEKLHIARDRAKAMLEEVKWDNILRITPNIPLGRLGDWEEREMMVHEAASRVGMSPAAADAIIDAANGHLPEEARDVARTISQGAAHIVQDAPEQVRHVVQQAEPIAQRASEEVRHAVHHVERAAKCNQQ